MNNNTLYYGAYRGRLLENKHTIHIAILRPNGEVVKETPKADQLYTFFRSAAKPFQVAPLIFSEYANILSSKEIALTCASHTGSLEHTKLSEAILKKAGLTEDALQCGPHPPLDKKAAKKVNTPTKIHNNCSGKHAGMLLYCVQKGYEHKTYLSPSHPLQQEVLSLISSIAKTSIKTATDGCGVPTYHMPITDMALLYAHLVSDKRFYPIVSAMTDHPVISGGKGRIDTHIMQVSEGHLLAKVGADGIICIGNLKTKEGLCLKVEDGNTDIRNMAIIDILIELSWLPNRVLKSPLLKDYYHIKRCNTLNEAVGHYQLIINEEG